MRGGDGDARAMNSTLETINAAATAIASAENRLTQPNVQKKRWGSCFSISACFGYSKNQKRIEPSPRGVDAAATAAAVVVANSTQAPSTTLPFAAPPSSPASFLQSGPPSIAQSPTGTLCLTSVSASMYSPGGPASIFAIGPYANETQLVSPPVFSTFTTEPSTAPFTPPPESVHLTTPSSPEVPFAQLLDPNIRNGETYQRFQVSHYDFHSYQLQPGSPVGQLISPRSGISASGTSSPLPDGEFTAGGSHILGFQAGDSPKLNFDKLSANENQRSHQGSGSLTPDAVRSTKQGSFLPNHWVSEIRLHLPPNNKHQNGSTINHMVSIELSAQEVLRSAEKKPAASTRDVSKSKNDEPKAEKGGNLRENHDNGKSLVAKSCDEVPQQTTVDEDEEQIHQKQLSREFNFDNADGGDSRRPNIVADWWANEKLVGKEEGPSKNWSFFPMIQPGLS